MYGKLEKLMTKIEKVTCNFKFQLKLQKSMSELNCFHNRI